MAIISSVGLKKIRKNQLSCHTKTNVVHYIERIMIESCMDKRLERAITLFKKSYVGDISEVGQKGIELSFGG